MSGAGGGLGRILNGLRFVVSRSPVKYAAVRNFYLQPACEAVRKVEMPSLSPTMEAGTIVKWHKKEGDTVAAGDVLCDIQTDKAVVSMEYEDDGILAKIVKPDDSKDIKVGVLIALMVDEGDDWKGVEVPAEATSSAPETSAPPPQPPPPPQPQPQPQAASAPPPPPSPQPAATAKPAGTAEDWHLVGPSVRKLLEEYKLSITDIPRSGPKGALLKGDVLNFLQQKGLPKPSAKKELEARQAAAHEAKTGQNYVDIPLTNMRKVIAKRLTESKTTIPHAYAAIDCAMGPVSQLRKKLAADGVKVSLNDFIIKAAGYALQKAPNVNATWNGEAAAPSSNVDISVAVATDSGLITPIVPNVPALGVTEISAAVKELAEKARAGRLRPQEFQGGSFTISNLGMFGIREFSAIINLPQVAIMAIGSAQPVLGENTNFQPKMTATLSYDNRAIDETEATQFLETFRAALENPDLLMSKGDLGRFLAQ